MREAMADAAAARVERAEQAMMLAATAYAARVRGVVLSRLQGPKARKHTRHWEQGLGEKSAELVRIETKQVDPDYVVPDSLIAESVEAMRDTVGEVAGDAAADAGRRVYGGHSEQGGMFEIDQDLLAGLIDEALEDMLGAAERYAASLREAILTGEAEDLPFDEIVDNVEQAADKGGNWLRLSARTVGTALAGKATIEQARALGVTHTQWISRRDPRVRATHVVADGQVRLVGDEFEVGAHRLEYPGDPTGLPDTAREVHGCRCGLLLADVDDALFAALEEISEAALADDDMIPGVGPLFDAAAASRIFGDGPDLEGLPNLANMVPLPDPVVGWRIIGGAVRASGVTPGQVIELPAGTVLGLAPPEDLEPETLAVRVPAGTVVGVAGGTITLPEGADATVLAAGEGGIQAAI